MKEIKINRLLSLIAGILCVFALTSCISSDPIQNVVDMGLSQGKVLTVSDVREKVKGIDDKYTREQIEDIIFIVNDGINQKLGTEDYYINTCDSLSKADVSEIYASVSGSTTNNRSVNNNEAEDSANSDENESKSRSRNRGDGGFIMWMIIGGGALVLVVGIVVVIVLIMISKGKNSKKSNDPKPSNTDFTPKNVKQKNPVEQQSTDSTASDDEYFL